MKTTERKMNWHTDMSRVDINMARKAVLSIIWFNFVGFYLESYLSFLFLFSLYRMECARSHRNSRMNWNP